MGESGIEREFKFSLPELQPLRERLVELDAERIAPSAFEDNLVFDRAGELKSSKCLLRLRSDARGARLTYKGAPSFEGGCKIRTEHETAVESAVILRTILESVGLEPVRRYQKHREEWRLGGVIIALDRTPIGDFVEFEGSGAATVVKRCGLEPGNAEPRNYLEIYDDYRREHPEAARDMVFPEETT